MWNIFYLFPSYLDVHSQIRVKCHSKLIFGAPSPDESFLYSYWKFIFEYSGDIAAYLRNVARFIERMNNFSSASDTTGCLSTRVIVDTPYKSNVCHTSSAYTRSIYPLWATHYIKTVRWFEYIFPMLLLCIDDEDLPFPK